MTKTTPSVTFGLFALAIKQDATFSMPDLQPFSKPVDLKTNNAAARPYITMEQDFWRLDGSYKFMPENDALVHVGLMSLAMTDATGAFAVPPVLTITFSQTHTTEGLTIRGAQASNDFANNITVAFYNAADALIRSDTYFVAAWEYSTLQAVADFQKIVITFNSTNKPYRYLRVTGIDYGELIHFSGADITTAAIVEDVDVLSLSLPVNTLELQLFSSDEAFNIIDPSGDFFALKNGQPLDVYVDVDFDRVYIGQYFLDTWENASATEILFNAIDMVGVLDKIPFVGGIWITPTTVGELLAVMFSAIGVPYDLDPDLDGVPVAGWIPAGSYRSALQQIAFAAGAYVTCARAGVIQIFKTILAVDRTIFESTITKAEKGAKQSLTLKTLITGVEVLEHNYLENAEVSELYNGVLPVGLHKITFNAPFHDLNITGAAITESGANYAIVNVTVAGTVVLSGEGYTDTTKLQSVHNLTLDPTVRTNVLAITDATLVNASNSATITQRVYDYYQQRYLQKVRLFAPAVAVGGSVEIETSDSMLGGVVEKMSFDIARGFVADTDIVGVIL